MHDTCHGHALTGQTECLTVANQNHRCSVKIRFTIVTMKQEENTRQTPGKRSAERNADTRFQVQLEKDGGSSVRHFCGICCPVTVWSLCSIGREKALTQLTPIKFSKETGLPLVYDPPSPENHTRYWCWQKITAQKPHYMQASITIHSTHSSSANTEPDRLLLAVRLHTMPATASLHIDVTSLLAQYHYHINWSSTGPKYDHKACNPFNDLICVINLEHHDWWW